MRSIPHPSSFDQPEGEPCEDDVLCEDRGGPFYYWGKRIADDPADLMAWMAKHSYWPDVWSVSDHGNTCNVTVSVRRDACDMQPLAP